MRLHYINLQITAYLSWSSVRILVCQNWSLKWKRNKEDSQALYSFFYHSLSIWTLVKVIICWLSCMLSDRVYDRCLCLASGLPVMDVDVFGNYQENLEERGDPFWPYQCSAPFPPRCLPFCFCSSLVACCCLQDKVNDSYKYNTEIKVSTLKYLRKIVGRWSSWQYQLNNHLCVLAFVFHGCRHQEMEFALLSGDCGCWTFHDCAHFKDFQLKRWLLNTNASQYLCPTSYLSSTSFWWDIDLVWREAKTALVKYVDVIFIIKQAVVALDFSGWIWR